MRVRGATALVTGASRGIGRALAFALAERGCALLLTGLERDELCEVADEVRRAHGIDAAACAADLCDDDARDALVAWVRARSGPLDILVNNAGGGRFGRFEAEDPPNVRRTVTLNVVAPTLLTVELLPLLRQRPRAAVVFTSSAIARLPYPGLAVYGAAKGYLSTLAEGLAAELAGSTVSVHCVHPGFTDTHFMASAGMDMTRVPRFVISPPEKVARHIVRAIERNVPWSFADPKTRLGVGIARWLPARVRVGLFRRLFWNLPA